MNREKTQQIINQIVEDFRNRTRHARQYAPAKHQIATLTELDILDLMPAKFGHGDAKIVIEEAQRGATIKMNSYGEGVDVAASDLYNAMNEVEFVTIPTYQPNLKSHLAAAIRDAEIIRGEIAHGKATSDTYQALILTNSKISQLKKQLGIS